MSAIHVDSVAKVYAAARALEQVSFTVEQGRLVVLLGPSGCGKSTTLRLIAGLDQPSSGRILIGGRDVTALAPSARGVSMVFQNYALFPHLTVADNITFGLEVRRVPREDRRRRLDRAAALLGLGPLLARKPSQLSGGQQQRVALARAIVAETPVCLMDEPLSNLDAQLRSDMRREIRALQQQLGVTMVYVTHDQVEAMTMADQVVLMRDGRIEQDAAPAELYALPASEFAARFIGTPPMNVLALADGAGGAVIRGLEAPQVLPGRGAGLKLGIRPEDIRLGAGIGVPARVAAVEYLGAESVVSLDVGAERATSRVPGRSRLERGAAVALTWAPEAVHLFDAATGRRVEAPIARDAPAGEQRRRETT